MEYFLHLFSTTIFFHFQCTPERCLQVLEYLNWNSSDFPKAIKIIRLQNIVKLTLTECAEALEQYDWDLKVTSEKMYPFKK